MAWIIRGSDQTSPSITSPHALSVTATMTAAAWNTQATHTVFAVTGLVRLRIWIECTTNVAGAGSIQFGHAEDTDALILTTLGTDLDAGYLWYDATPTLKVDLFANVVMDVVSDGIAVGYEITGAALTDGVLVFHCNWEALNAAGAVVAGDGGAM